MTFSLSSPVVVGAKAPYCNEIGKIYSLWSLDLEGCSSLKLFSEARWSLNPLFPLLKELGPADVGVSLKKTKNEELITIGYFRVPRASISKRGWVVSLWYDNDFSFSCKESHFHKNGCALALILKVRVFGTRKWPIFIGTQSSLVITVTQDILGFWIPPSGFQIVQQ